MKTNSIERLCPVEGYEGEVINYGKYYSRVIEIFPISFDTKTEDEQDLVIQTLSFALPTSMSKGESVHIVKLERPLLYDERKDACEIEKKETLLELFDEGKMTENELLKRVEILEEESDTLEELSEMKIMKPHFYFQLFAESKVRTNDFVLEMTEYIVNAGLNCKVLAGEELAVFLKNGYVRDFDERELYSFETMTKSEVLEHIMPKRVQFKRESTLVDETALSIFDVYEYPFEVDNCWLYKLMNLESTKVVVQLSARERDKSIKDIDRSLRELRSKLDSKSKDSEVLDVQSHIETLQQLLVTLKQDGDSLFDVNIISVAYDEPNGKFENKRAMRRVLNECGLRSSGNQFRQEEAFFASSPSRFKSTTVPTGINSSSIVASFPFVKFGLEDEEGFFIGEGADGTPAFIDFFLRNNDRVNSNALIVGRSGGGKSFCLKTMLFHLSARDSIIMNLDPEGEYRDMTKFFGGDVIDVGKGGAGRINPLEMIEDLEEEAEEEGNNEMERHGYFDHLNFLAEWFKIVLEGIDADALQFLDKALKETYLEKGIDGKTDLSKLQSGDYPILEDLYNTMRKNLETSKNEYEKTQLMQLEIYLAKFAKGGRYSMLWNGATTMKPLSRMVDYNFRALLASGNEMTKNAQMALVLRIINQSIISNLEYNKKYNKERKIIVVIDEAHVFIDKKFQTALDFIHQLSKRIRKYGGALIVATQNIKDFVQTGEIAVKSSAIINNCQYSLIFKLSENDLNDLQELYKNNPLNDNELHCIKSAKRGQAFMITGSEERVSLNIVASDKMSKWY